MGIIFGMYLMSIWLVFGRYLEGIWMVYVVALVQDTTASKSFVIYRYVSGCIFYFINIFISMIIDSTNDAQLYSPTEVSLKRTEEHIILDPHSMHIRTRLVPLR